jgi:hypothetical protein
MNLPFYRDWYVLPDYSNTKLEFIDIGIIEKFLVTIINTFNLRQDILLYIYCLFWLLFVFYINKQALKKIIFKLNFIHSKAYTYYSGTLLIIFNNWTFERLLTGQINVLRGYLMILPLTYFFFDLFILDNEKFNFKKYLKASSLIILLALLNIHYFSILIIVVIVLSIYLFIIRQIILKNILYLTAFIPTIPVIIFNFNFFLKRYNSNPEEQYQIIERFSPKIKESFQNFYFQVLGGKGNWMSNTFTEVDSIKSQLGIYSNFIPYYNESLNLAFVIVVLFLVYYLGFYLIKTKSSKIRLFQSSILIATIFLILTFGLSNSVFYRINFYFYKIPLTYIFRESGKFFAVYNLILVILITISINVLNNSKIKAGIQLFGILYLLANLSFCLLLTTNLNFKNHSEIKTQLESICGNNKILFLPYDLYYKSEYSNQIFVSNFWHELTNCNFIKPETSHLSNSNRELYLYQNNFNKELMLTLQTKTCNYEFFKINSIYLIMLDSKNYKYLQFFEACLIENSFEVIDIYNFKLYKLAW